MKQTNNFLIILLPALFVFCTAFSSKPIDNKSTDIKTEAPMAKTIKVYKKDGSLQCHADTGFTLDEMSKQLNDIKVIAKERKHDGKMRATVCGNHTGYINIYEISEADLDKAIEYGFEKLKR